MCACVCVRFVHLLVVCCLVCPSGFVTGRCLYERLCERERFDLCHINEIQRHMDTVVIIIIIIKIVLVLSTSVYTLLLMQKAHYGTN